jgi:DNA-directed RNA polymerase subunit N (RpoN/RPB10)
MEPQQRPVEWITPFANAFTLEFCSMAVDNLLQLHVYLQERTAKGEDPRKVFEELGMERYCCRAIFLGQNDTLELVNKFKKF